MLTQSLQGQAERERERERERQASLRQAAQGLGTLEDLEIFSRLFREDSYSKLQLYLKRWEASLNDQMWGQKAMSLEEVYYLKGQMRAVHTMQALPEEIRKSIDALKE